MSEKEMSISEAVASGSRLNELLAMHRRCARILDDDDTQDRDWASISRRAMELSKEIAVLRLETEGDDVGDAAGAPDEAFTA